MCLKKQYSPIIYGLLDAVALFITANDHQSFSLCQAVTSYPAPETIIKITWVFSMGLAFKNAISQPEF